MVKLIKYFNENYGQQYGNVEYPRTKKEIYQTYQIIKAYGIKDDTLMSLLNECVLPKPTSIKEREMYSECLYEVGKNGKLSEFENDLYYENRTCFLELTNEDFTYDEDFESYVYKQTPKLDFLNNMRDINKLGYELTIFNDGEKQVFTEKDNRSFYLDYNNYDSSFNDKFWFKIDGLIYYDIMRIYNGVYYNEDSEFIFNNILTVEYYDEMIFNLKLFKIEIKKMPNESINFPKICIENSEEDNYKINDMTIISVIDGYYEGYSNQYVLRYDKKNSRFFIELPSMIKESYKYYSNLNYPTEINKTLEQNIELTKGEYTDGTIAINVGYNISLWDSTNQIEIPLLPSTKNHKYKATGILYYDNKLFGIELEFNKTTDGGTCTERVTRLF